MRVSRCGLLHCHTQFVLFANANMLIVLQTKHGAKMHPKRPHSSESTPEPAGVASKRPKVCFAVLGQATGILQQTVLKPVSLLVSACLLQGHPTVAA